MVKLDLKGSIDHGFGQGAFLVAPLGKSWVRACVASRGSGCTAGVHQALQVVCPPIEAGKHGKGLNG